MLVIVISYLYCVYYYAESTISSTEHYSPLKLRSRFPYLKLEDIPQEEVDQHLLKLSHRTDIMKRRFQSFVSKLKQYIKDKYDLEEVIDVLVDYDKKFTILRGCKILNDLFLKLSGYYSFYDYAVIKVLTTTIGSSTNKKELKKYKQKFREYWEKRICEIPQDAFSNDIKESEKFKVKLDKDLETLKGENIETLKFEMRRILGHKLQFLYAKDGCVLLVFRSYEHVSSFTKEQQLDLKHCGVLSIHYGEKLILEISKGKYYT